MAAITRSQKHKITTTQISLCVSKSHSSIARVNPHITKVWWELVWDWDLSKVTWMGNFIQSNTMVLEQVTTEATTFQIRATVACTTTRTVTYSTTTSQGTRAVLGHKAETVTPRPKEATAAWLRPIIAVKTSKKLEAVCNFWKSECHQETSKLKKQ